MTTTTSATATLDCPGCGARNPTETRRCRICTRVLNHRVPHLEIGLAALHPDTGHGATFGAAWGRGPSRTAPVGIAVTDRVRADRVDGTDAGGPGGRGADAGSPDAGSPDAGSPDAGGPDPGVGPAASDPDAAAPTPEEQAELDALLAPRWESFPIEATIAPWEPTANGTDDESVELAATIVLEAPLRNGRTPPPLEFEHEHFDPDGLDWDRDRP